MKMRKIAAVHVVARTAMVAGEGFDRGERSWEELRKVSWFNNVVGLGLIYIEMEFGPENFC